MTRSILWTAGAAVLALGLSAVPATRADAGRHYIPAQAITHIEPAARVDAGSRVYHVTDDPSYDLSGTSHTLFLVDDGTAVRAPAGKTVAYARAGGMPTEVLSIPATYRQDWMAVAAGDRPVRCLTPIAGVVGTTEPSMMSRGPMTDEQMYRAAHPVRYSATHRRPYRKNHAKLSFASYRPARAERYEEMGSNEYASVEATYAVSEGVLGHELYQLGNSWYLQDENVWCRAESWRGPYVQVKKGMVPREVREAAKAREEMDHDQD